MDQTSSNWVKVFSTGKPWQAEMAKQILSDNGIEAIVINQQDSSYLIGEAHVMVEHSLEAKARELLANLK